MKRKIAEILVEDDGGAFMNIMPNLDIRILENALDGLYKKVIETRVRVQIEQQNKAIIIDPATGQKAINLKVGALNHGDKKSDSKNQNKNNGKKGI